MEKLKIENSYLHSSDDALHFCTALLSKCNAFVTEDYKLRNKIRKYGTIPAFDLTDREDSESLATILELD
jgi:hypothetical protein